MISSVDQGYLSSSSCDSNIGSGIEGLRALLRCNKQRNFKRCGSNPSQLPLADGHGAQKPDGTWARAGEYITVVSKDSALLGLPQAVEERMAAEGNHSTMVKFGDRSSADYTKALDFLHIFEKEAKAVVEKQFRSGT